MREARTSEKLRKTITDKYEPIEKALLQLGQKDGETDVLEKLKSWKPSGPAN